MVTFSVKAGVVSVIGAVLMVGAPAPAQAAVNWHYVTGYATYYECASRGIAGSQQGVWYAWQCRHPTPRYWELWADDQCRICLASVEAVRVDD